VNPAERPVEGRERVVLKGGIVMSLDPAVGDFDAADVLVENGRILAVGPELDATGHVVDCSGLVVMPGFIETHRHQYETLMRAIVPDGLLIGSWPQESYFSVVQDIWTAGRIGDPDDPVWDLGRPPLDPEDVYLAELVASLGSIAQGVTMTADTSQSSHTARYTDAMIEGLLASGHRALFVYSHGVDRGSYEFPGAVGDRLSGLGRLADTYFTSKDQLLTLGAGTYPWDGDDAATGWQIARAFDAHITNHNVGMSWAVLDAAADPRNGDDWSDVTLVHCTRWQDEPVAQIGCPGEGFGGRSTSRAMQIVADRGAHVSISPLVELQMGHGLAPLQLALNHGVLPSLSPDVDTNMTAEPFALMRGAFALQRGLANELRWPESNPGDLDPPQLITARQVVEMMTIAGAAGNGVLDRVGTLTPGKEADIVFLDTRNLDIAPAFNVPGAVVTLMNQHHVRHVMIAGRFRLWNHELVDVDVPALVAKLEAAQERALGRIQGPAKTGTLPPGRNSLADPYRPNRFGSTCIHGQNTTAPPYQLRP
jgi:cytosine/adenosine deaminase-related metal-dependent hydrolase